MSDQAKRKAQSSASVQSEAQGHPSSSICRKRLKSQDKNTLVDFDYKIDNSVKVLDTNLENLKLSEMRNVPAALKPEKGKGKAIAAWNEREPAAESLRSTSSYQQDWIEKSGGPAEEPGPSTHQACVESDNSDLGYEHSLENSNLEEGEHYHKEEYHEEENSDQKMEDEEEARDDGEVDVPEEGLEDEEETSGQEHVCGEQCRQERSEEPKHIHSEECARSDIFSTSSICICLEDPRLRSKRILSGELIVPQEHFNKELERVIGHMYPIMRTFERAVFDGSPSQTSQAARYGSYPIFRAAIRKESPGIIQLIRSDWVSSMSEASWSLYNVLKAAPTKYTRLDNWPILPRELKPFEQGICSACGKTRGPKKDLRCGQEIVYCIYPGEEHRNWRRE